MRLRVAVDAVAWAVVALVAAALLSAPGGPLGPGLAQAEAALVLAGDARDLVPGKPASLHVTLVNDGASAVAVATVTAEVSGGTAACPSSALRVTPWTGALTVAAGGSAQVALPLTVADRPACAGHSWQLAYAAS